MTSFDAVAAEYEGGRPDYPDAVFDALEPLAGRRVPYAIRRLDALAKKHGKELVVGPI
jgi:hypothetical protein